MWLDAFTRATAGLTERAAAVAIGGQQHGMVALDARGAVVRDALLWNDTRSASAAADLVRGLGGPTTTAEAVAERAQTEPAVRSALNRLGRDVGLGLVTLANVLDPQVIVLGGYFVPLGEHVLAQAPGRPERAACRPGAPSPERAAEHARYPRRRDGRRRAVVAVGP